MSDTTFLYVIPEFFCEKCGADLRLPYPDLPEVTDSQWREGQYTGPMDSLPDGWTVVFGCRKCGHVDIYDVDWVGETFVQKRNRGRYHNETNCFSVRLQCARLDCKAPTTLHTDLEDKEGAPDLIQLLRKGFFHGTVVHPSKLDSWGRV
jgi:hypothetical protein